MTSQDQDPIGAAPSSLTVRAAAGQLRIIPVWQALGQHAAHAKRIRVHCSRKQDFFEMTVTFESVSPTALTDITRRLSAQPWVVAASLHTAPASPPRGDS
ncbi:hypothetical protein AYM40_09900 [Paraburkholderia phytofirmans OLGA172]|uniref:AsnC family transcriptional regulator n=1 Tax=Paraburkholderia phytofirmans OLGA172 TaxID=1417228 RepID=A0A160FKQ2_9BURK|nr:hypothetical protein AYM40_09900 [Paraburkholderia phytofirmans OLGA172]